MKVAIVTAGGSGMGAATARRLAEDGHKIAVLSSSGRGKALAEELDGIGVTGSNQSNDDLKKLVDEVMGAWGRVDVLVNSAGHGPRDQILKITDEQWHNGLDTYLMNVIRPTHLVAPIMAQQRAEPSSTSPLPGPSNRAQCSQPQPFSALGLLHSQRYCRPLCGPTTCA